MCSGRYDRSDSVVSASTASRTRRTSPVEVVRRSFPGGPQARAAARQEGRDYEPASVLLERILTERRRRWSESGKKGKYEEPTLPDTTEKQRSITTVGITRKRRIMLTPQAVMPSMPEITPKKRERLTPRNTARSNIPEDLVRPAVISV